MIRSYPVYRNTRRLGDSGYPWNCGSEPNLQDPAYSTAGGQNRTLWQSQHDTWTNCINAHANIGAPVCPAGQVASGSPGNWSCISTTDPSAGTQIVAPYTPAAVNTDNTAYVTQIYQQYLGRPPQASELQGWLTALASGASHANFESAVQSYMQTQNAANTASVTATLQAAVGRPLNANEIGWIPALVADLLNNSMTPADVAAAIAKYVATLAPVAPPPAAGGSTPATTTTTTPPPAAGGSQVITPTPPTPQTIAEQAALNALQLATANGDTQTLIGTAPSTTPTILGYPWYYSAGAAGALALLAFTKK